MKFLKRIAIFLFIFLLSSQNVFAAKFSDEMKDFIAEKFPKSELRFDGLITLPDGTLYLPLYPALVKYPSKISVRETISVNPNSKHPEIIILNNDFVFMKVIKDKNGNNTLLYMKNPPLEVKTGLLPQDMLVPSGLTVPDNIKGIIGNLSIQTVESSGLKVELTPTDGKKKYSISVNPHLKGKVFYVLTSRDKDILVFKTSSSIPQYALEQTGIVRDFDATPDNKFLLVTNYNKNSVDVISLADDMKIKELDLSSEGGEILVDEQKNKAYISAPMQSLLYVLDLKTMTLTQKIKLKGRCAKLVLTDNNRKIFYCDIKTNEVWSVELDNDYVTKYIGSFPNISKIEYGNGKVFLSSRVASRLAVVDYKTLNLIAEMPVNEKPVDMLVYKNYLYILSAAENTLQIYDLFKDEITGEIKLNTKGFSTEIYKINNSGYAVVTDAVSDLYSVVDLNKNILLGNSAMNVSASKVLILPEIRKN